MSDIEKAETEAVLDIDMPTAHPQQPPASISAMPEPRMKDEKSSESPSLLDWSDENDPANPRNWSLAIRSYHAMVPGLFGFAV